MLLGVKKKTAIIVVDDVQEIKSYLHAVQASSLFNIQELFTGHVLALKWLGTNQIDYIFLGIDFCDQDMFESARTELLNISPRSKIILLGLERYNQSNHYYRRPIRGVIDLTIQEPRYFNRTLRNILKNGWDFSLIIRNSPQLSDAVTEYSSIIPRIDDRFWELLPLLTTKYSQNEIALYMNCSRRTLQRMIKAYCDELGVSGLGELIIVAAENHWINRESAHAAHNKLMKFLIDLGEIEV